MQIEFKRKKDPFEALKAGLSSYDITIYDLVSIYELNSGVYADHGWTWEELYLRRVKKIKRMLDPSFSVIDIRKVSTSEALDIKRPHNYFLGTHHKTNQVIIIAHTKKKIPGLDEMKS